MATNEEKTREEEIKKIQAMQSSKLLDIMHQFHINDLFDIQKPGFNHEEAIFYLLEYIEGETTASIKEGIYRNISCVKWLSDEKLVKPESVTSIIGWEINS
ncbi:hypothetical protein [Methylomarinum vadi]|uniref:hypothetical protein n=1 Tax=Methylomarinum vadi TaxID=438855 RepID=UPI0004DFA527|nr:hypothetical protein [Methylomarinum vadi]